MRTPKYKHTPRNTPFPYKIVDIRKQDVNKKEQTFLKQDLLWQSKQ